MQWAWGGDTGRGQGTAAEVSIGEGRRGGSGNTAMLDASVSDRSAGGSEHRGRMALAQARCIHDGRRSLSLPSGAV